MKKTKESIGKPLLNSDELRKKQQERIRKAYKDSGMTYNQLAEYLGIKRNTLANWLTKKGRRVPPDYVITLIEEKVREYLDKTKEERG